MALSGTPLQSDRLAGAITSPSIRLRGRVEEGVGAGADIDAVSVGAVSVGAASIGAPTTELGEGWSWSMGTDVDDGADRAEATLSPASSTAKDPKANAAGSAVGELGGTVSGPAEKLCG